MKNVLLATCAFALALSLTSCKKDEDNEPNNSANLFQQSSDESVVSSENDVVFDNINTVYQTAEAPGGGRVAAINICGATTTITGNNITLNFNNANPCSDRVRGGQIVLSLIAGTKFRDVNAVVRISYNDYEVTRTINGVSRKVKFNGTQYVKNVSGGNIWDLAAGGTLIHKISGNMQAQFDNQILKRTWAIARTRTYTKTAADAYQISITGDSTYNGQTNVDIVGTNRFGDKFWVITSSPVVAGNTCGWWKPISGKRAHYNDNDSNLIVTFGTNSSGNIDAANCPAYYKVAYTSARGRSYTSIIPY